MKKDSVILRQGVYVVGDVSFAFEKPNSDFIDLVKWKEFVNDVTDNFENTLFKYKNAFGVIFRVDNNVNDILIDNYDNEYWIQKKNIGLFPVEHYTNINTIDEYSHIVTFSEPIECYEENNVLHFGDYEINLSPEDEHYVDFEDDDIGEQYYRNGLYRGSDYEQEE